MTESEAKFSEFVCLARLVSFLLLLRLFINVAKTDFAAVAVVDTTVFTPSSTLSAHVTADLPIFFLLLLWSTAN